MLRFLYFILIFYIFKSNKGKVLKYPPGSLQTFFKLWVCLGFFLFFFLDPLLPTTNLSSHSQFSSTNLTLSLRLKPVCGISAFSTWPKPHLATRPGAQPLPAAGSPHSFAPASRLMDLPSASRMCHLPFLLIACAPAVLCALGINIAI